MRARSAKSRGFTLTEILVVVTIMGMLVGSLVSISIDTTRLGKTIVSEESLSGKSRAQLDVMMKDIQDAGAILATYTNGSTYTTDANGNLILQVPSHDASGDLLTTNDVIVYHRVGASAPYTLKRIVFPTAGSSRASTGDVTILSNIDSISTTYFVDQMLTGTGSATTFPLVGTPLTSPERIVLVNGVKLQLGAAPGEVQYMSGTPYNIVFGTAPAQNAPIDAVYAVDPAASASFITGVLVDLTLSTTNNALKGSKTQTAKYSSQATLRNHT